MKMISYLILSYLIYLFFIFRQHCRTESDNVEINNGVLQGSNFGQTFFSIYFNDTLNVPEYMTGHLFADDFQAHLEVDFDKINEGINRVNSDLNKINDFV